MASLISQHVELIVEDHRRPHFPTELYTDISVASIEEFYLDGGLFYDNLLAFLFRLFLLLLIVVLSRQGITHFPCLV